MVVIGAVRPVGNDSMCTYLVVYFLFFSLRCPGHRGVAVTKRPAKPGVEKAGCSSSSHSAAQ